MEHLLQTDADERVQSANFVLQKDAYVRLGDPDIEFDVPFVTYEYTQITSDESLDFSLSMYARHFVLTIGPTAMNIPYEVFGFSATAMPGLTPEEIAAAEPKTIAENIICAVQLLLSGQIALGCSWRNDELMAAETFLSGYEPRPIPIAVSANFSLLKRTSFEYSVKQNRSLASNVPISPDFPLIPPVENGKRLQRGRIIDSVHGLEPLSFTDYAATQGAGKGLLGLIYRVWYTKAA